MTESLAFDLYGTLVDPIRIWKHLEHYLPSDAQRIAEIWRQKQLEYTFRLTAMERYEDFEQVTRKALDYALLAVGKMLDAQQKDALMQQYNDLERFPDVEPGLQRLKDARFLMVVFSNGSPAMLKAIMQTANLYAYVSGFVSVDEVKTYKPAPKVYLHLAERLGRKPEEVRLISSNPFDVIGAMSAGMQATWVNRSGGLFDTLGEMPEMVVGNLVELVERLVR
ncbi:MAG TPA: haloacid dehalogenase type II [Ktedonobacteraceae bacterium]|jgi:2-haloacid dehalogenase|nr:haloacid dehalogenase type II [Ktedonobacteraceae bacterium]